jgi:hypothetical protein
LSRYKTKSSPIIQTATGNNLILFDNEIGCQ